MSRGFWLIPFALLLALIASYLLWHNRVQQSQIPIGPIPSSMTAQSRLDAPYSPKVAAALERRLPANFKSDDGMQRTVHRIGDTLNVDIFLIYATFDESGVRPDAPITVNVSGKKLRDALLAIFSSDDPPLHCTISGEMILITAPNFTTPTVLNRTYVVDDIANDPASAQQLLIDLQNGIGSQTHLGHSARGSTMLSCNAGRLTVAQPPVFHYFLTSYLNELHRRQAIVSVTIRTTSMCGGAIVLVLRLELRLRSRLVQRHRSLARAYAPTCGYDASPASVDRCPRMRHAVRSNSPNPHCIAHFPDGSHCLTT